MCLRILKLCGTFQNSFVWSDSIFNELIRFKRVDSRFFLTSSDRIYNYYQCKVRWVQILGEFSSSARELDTSHNKLFSFLLTFEVKKTRNSSNSDEIYRLIDFSWAYFVVHTRCCYCYCCCWYSNSIWNTGKHSTEPIRILFEVNSFEFMHCNLLIGQRKFSLYLFRLHLFSGTWHEEIVRIIWAPIIPSNGYGMQFIVCSVCKQ